MRTRARMLIVVGFLMGCGSLSLQANLITNGSFETPVVPAAGFTTFASGSSGITGWTVVGATGGVAIVSGTFSQECCSFPAEDPTPESQWLDLTGLNTNAVEGVEQTVATSLGTQYTLSFWVGNIFDSGGIFGTSSTVDVRLGGISGTLIDTAINNSMITGTQVWQQFSTTFTAAGPSTTIDFINGDPGSDNSNGLDNVVLLATGTAAVPEPGTLSLLGAGIISLGLFRGRKAV